MAMSVTRFPCACEEMKALIGAAAPDARSLRAGLRALGLSDAGTSDDAFERADAANAAGRIEQLLRLRRRSMPQISLAARLLSTLGGVAEVGDVQAELAREGAHGAPSDVAALELAGRCGILPDTPSRVEAYGLTYLVFGKRAKRRVMDALVEAERLLRATTRRSVAVSEVLAILHDAGLRPAPRLLEQMQLAAHARTYGNARLSAPVERFGLAPQIARLLAFGGPLRSESVYEALARDPHNERISLGDVEAELAANDWFRYDAGKWHVSTQEVDPPSTAEAHLMNRLRSARAISQDEAIQALTQHGLGRAAAKKLLKRSPFWRSWPAGVYTLVGVRPPAEVFDKSGPIEGMRE